MRGKLATKMTRKRQLDAPRVSSTAYHLHFNRDSINEYRLFDKEILVPAADRRSPDQCEIAFLSCVPLARKNAMNDSQVQQPTEPILAAIKPFLNKAISIWNFYYVQKAGPYHPFGRIRIAPFGKGGLRILAELGYTVQENPEGEMKIQRYYRV